LMMLATRLQESVLPSLFFTSKLLYGIRRIVSVLKD
jgi:hypothetical protein